MVLFDPEARHRELAAMSEADRSFLCGPPSEEWQSFKAITRPRAPGSERGQSAEPFAMEVMPATAWTVPTHDRASGRAVARVMNRWANGRIYDAAQALGELGFTAVYDLGGLTAWTEGDLPLDRQPS